MMNLLSTLAVVDPACEINFLGIPSWYQYLDVVQGADGICSVTSNIGLGNNEFWLVAAAVIEILLRIGVYVALVFVFYGGFRIIASGGSSDYVAEGRKTIVNAIVGMAIGIMASSIVGYLASELAKNTTARGGFVDTDGDATITFVLNLVYRLAGGVAVIFVVLSGLRFVTANGDPQRIAQARNSVIYAVVGLLVTLASVTILALVGSNL